METVDGHSAAKIKPMGLLSVHARYQLKLFAARAPTLLRQPAEQLRAMALRASVFVDDEVIYAQQLAAIDHLHETKTSYGHYQVAFREVRKMKVIVAHEAADGRDISISGQLRTQLTHDVKSALHIFISDGDSNHCGLRVVSDDNCLMAKEVAREFRTRR